MTENVDSAQVNRYVLTVSGDQGIAKNVRPGETAQVNLLNSYSQKTSVTVTKDWKDGDNHTLSGDKVKDLSATVTLYWAVADDESGELQVVPESERSDYRVTLTASSEHPWTYTWENLPMKDAEGNEYVYYVAEDKVSGFSTKYEPVYSEGENYFGRAEASELDDTRQYVTVTNAEEVAYAIPATGGTGTRRIYLLSIMLITVAGIGLVMIRRRSEIRGL